MEKFKPATEQEIQRRRDFYSGKATPEVRQFAGFTNFDLWNQVFPEGFSPSIPTISETSAQKLSVVFTCLNVHGETAGSLPCDVKQYTDKGRITVSTNPVYRLIHDRPNPLMTAFDFWSLAARTKLAWGNFYAEIKRNGRMEPVALWPLQPWNVTHTITPLGEYYYNYQGRQISATDILHFKNYTLDGLCGISTIRQNALSIGRGLKLGEYSSSLIGERPYGYLSSDAKPKDLQTKENIQGLWSTKQSVKTLNPQTVGTNSGSLMGIPYLYGGLKFNPLTLPADDVQYIETAGLTNTEIYGIFRVPPTFGQNWKDTPYNGAEQQDIVFAKYTLAYLKEIEQECTEKLFPESNKRSATAYYVKFNLKGILAGDSTTRQKFYTALFNIGVVNANEIREYEDLPTYEGGNEYFIQGALVPVSKIADFIQSKIDGANKDPIPGQSRAEMRQEFMDEMEIELKSKLNGHFKDVADLFQ